jgi:hypothetical protein
MKPDNIEPGTFVAPNAENPWPVAGPVKPDEGVEPLLPDRDNVHRIPKLNLLQKVGAEPVVVPVLVPAEGVPVVARKKSLLPVWMALAAVVLLGGGTAGYVVYTKKPAPVAVVRSTPSPTALPTPSPTAVATPSPSPTATPTPSVAPQTVTGLTATPTAGHPQNVTVTSKSGLWLRSSATSINQSNVIGWMPNGSTVSVDSIGSFWWHGTYRGTSGYFASKYTQ